jgi:hypothetical protein
MREFQAKEIALMIPSRYSRLAVGRLPNVHTSWKASLAGDHKIVAMHDLRAA